MDKLTPTARGALMARIRSKNTKPELFVRRLLHRLGYRFRLHRKDLPGHPDIVLPGHRKIVMVHGCFWHGHTCRLASKPKSNKDYWLPKIQANRARDVRNLDALRKLDWNVLELWECEVRQNVGIERRVREFMCR